MSTTRYSPNKYHIAHNNSDCNILGHRIRGGFKNHSHRPIFRCFARKLLSSPASTIHLVKMNMNAETDKKTDFWTATLNWLLIKGRKSDRSAPPCETLQQCNVQLWNRAMCNSCHLPDRLLQLSIWLILKETIAILFTRWLWCIFHVCLSSTEKISWDFLLCAFTTQCHPLLHWHLPRHHHHHCPQDHHFCFARSTLDELQCGHFVGADRLLKVGTRNAFVGVGCCCSQKVHFLSFGGKPVSPNK